MSVKFSLPRALIQAGISRLPNWRLIGLLTFPLFLGASDSLRLQWTCRHNEKYFEPVLPARCLN